MSLRRQVANGLFYVRLMEAIRCESVRQVTLRLGQAAKNPADLDPPTSTR